MNQPNRAFTLLELLVVLTLIALIAATAVPQFSSTYQKSRMETAAVQLVTIDRHVRSLAQKRHQSAQLRFDLKEHRVHANWDGDDMVVSTDLPASIEIASIVSRREKRSSGQAVIRIDEDGTAESYAIELICRSQKQWYFVAGLTGQVTQLDSRRQVEGVFRAID